MINIFFYEILFFVFFYQAYTVYIYIIYNIYYYIYRIFSWTQRVHPRNSSQKNYTQSDYNKIDSKNGFATKNVVRWYNKCNRMTVFWLRKAKMKKIKKSNSDLTMTLKRQFRNQDNGLRNSDCKQWQLGRIGNSFWSYVCILSIAIPHVSCLSCSIVSFLRRTYSTVLAAILEN